MKTSESITNIAQALLKFHTLIEPIKKESVNPYFKSKYADLSSILKAIKNPLKETGLIITQFPNEDGLTTLLLHSESGEYIQATAKLLLSKQDPQGQGSGITYMRRYAISSVLGLDTEDDDDGNSTSNFAQNNTPQSFEAQSSYNTPQTFQQYENGEVCNNCGSAKATSQKGKSYCTNYCWLPESERAKKGLTPLQPKNNIDDDISINDIPF